MSHAMSFQELARAAGRESVPTSLPVICIQGLGFVGAAMAVAVAGARKPDGSPRFNVIGVELDSEEGRRKVQAINAGGLPFSTSDTTLTATAEGAHREGNLVATTDVAAYGLAEVIVVDVHCDVSHVDGSPVAELDGFKTAVATLGRHASPGCLVVIETTVPPGTCEKIVAPLLDAEAERRGLEVGSFLLAHSYERVMPGPQYLDSIINFWRVFSGATPEAAERCEKFLSAIIDTESYPLTRLDSTTATETAKVLENSYRAVNIAFIEEWGRFAERAGFDLFEVIRAIRRRPTHNNIRQPGFGVGGYCLTKDPLLVGIGAHDVLGFDDLEFPFSSRAVEVNNAMPLVSLDRLQQMLGGSLEGKRIYLLGVSYRSDVGDTRYSPSEIFAREGVRRGARMSYHDPLVEQWPEMDLDGLSTLQAAGDFDAIVFAVGHREYGEMDLASWLGSARPAVLDANAVLSDEQRRQLLEIGVRVESIGRGTAS